MTLAQTLVTQVLAQDGTDKRGSAGRDETRDSGWDRDDDDESREGIVKKSKSILPLNHSKSRRREDGNKKMKSYRVPLNQESRRERGERSLNQGFRGCRAAGKRAERESKRVASRERRDEGMKERKERRGQQEKKSLLKLMIRRRHFRQSVQSVSHFPHFLHYFPSLLSSPSLCSALLALTVATEPLARPTHCAPYTQSVAHDCGETAIYSYSASM